jgi:prepilin-type N-terminal cleavage/methylation domain-containing protein
MVLRQLIEHRRSNGFTLIELMIVVAVIAIIAAIAIPSLLHARIAANEASAISTLRTVSTVSAQYRVRFGSYAGSLANLYAGGFIDSSVASSSKAGYTFVYAPGANTYTFNGNPTNPGVSGQRYFYIDSSGVVRFSTTGAATAADSALGN